MLLYRLAHNLRKEPDSQMKVLMLFSSKPFWSPAIPCHKELMIEVV